MQLLRYSNNRPTLQEKKNKLTQKIFVNKDFLKNEKPCVLYARYDQRELAGENERG